jgi:hypothetical protein
MFVRVLQFLLGAALAGGGGYLAWTHRADAANLFPPGAAGLPLFLLAGAFGVTSGIVFLVSAVHPRSNQKRALAARASREEAALGEADAYYSQRARAADRDWRSGDITPPAPPPEPPQTVAAVQSAEASEPAPPEKPRSLSTPPVASKPAAPAAEVPAKPAAKPVARSEPAANGASAPPPSPFPAQVTLAPLPRAAEPPPVAAPQSPKPTATPAPAPDDPHAAIRAAIRSGNLDEADRMLATARETATGMDLALLTALAADHAAVSGRQSHAKWLWRLALKRFGELGVLNSDAAKAVAESLRQAS